MRNIRSLQFLAMRVLMILLLTCPMFLAAQSVSNTYTAGDIPSSLLPDKKGR